MIYAACLSTCHHFVIIGEWSTIIVRTVSFILTILLYTGIKCVWCFTINIYGETYIEAGVPYIVTCNVSQVKEDRTNYFYSKISNINQSIFTLRHSSILGCLYLSGTYVLCQPGVCSCDIDGLATHWT